jgi:hypothetical protein
MLDIHIGILYSTATGIVLRTINPDETMGDIHLNWLEVNKPEGTTLLIIRKSLIGADERNMPNLDFLIPYVKKNHNVELSFGKRCIIVDSEHNVVRAELACPILHQVKLNKDAEEYNKNKHPTLPEVVPHKCIPDIEAEIGDYYNHDLKVHVKQKDRK